MASPDSLAGPLRFKRHPALGPSCSVRVRELAHTVGRIWRLLLMTKSATRRRTES